MEQAHFEKFGRVGYVSETKVSEFVAGLEKGEILGTRCSKCGTLHFPPRADCKICLTSEMEWISLSGKCELVTFSKVGYAPAALKEDAPYVLAVAKLSEGAKVFAPVGNGVRADQLMPGLRMILAPVRKSNRIFYELRVAG